MKLMTRFWHSLSELNHWIGDWIETFYIQSIPGAVERLTESEKEPFYQCDLVQTKQLSHLLKQVGWEGDWDSYSEHLDTEYGEEYWQEAKQ